MTLPALENWEPTRNALHKTAKVVSVIKRLGVERDEHFYHHHALKVVQGGLTSGKTDLGEFSIDFTSQTLIYQAKSQTETRLPLAIHNEKSLFETLLKAVRTAGFDINPDGSELTDETPFVVNPGQAFEYTQTLFIINKALAEARDELSYECTDLVVFPHHFDLSFLWFNARAENENQPHVNFGFSPGDDTIARPYFYSYAWDGKEYIDIDVEPPLLHEEAFSTGVIMSYDEIIAVADDPIKIIKSAVNWIKDAVEPVLWG